MIKKRHDLTESDKQKFYKAVVEEHNKAFDIPWSSIERDMERFLDEAFDDTLFTKMSPDDQIDAAYCRKAFNNKKPSLIDYMIWSGTFVTHSEYVEIPD